MQVIDMMRLSNRTILLMALALRLIIVACAVRDPQIPIEPDHYLKIGHNIIAQNFYDFEVFPPIYVMLCGFMSFFLGAHAILTMLILQAILGTITVYFLMQISDLVFKNKNATVAVGIISALDPTLILQTGFILTETLYVFLISALLFLFLKTIYRSGYAKSQLLLNFAGCGMFLGLAVMTRSVGIVLLPVLLFTLIVIFLERGKSLLPAVVLFLSFQATIAPWCLRNYVQWGSYAVSSSGPQNFAALFVGVAKMRAENKPLIASFDAWELDHPLTPDEIKNPFTFASAYSLQAKKWLGEHPIDFAKGFIVGQLNLFFGPYQSGWAQILYGPDEIAKPLPKLALAGLIFWRIFVALFTFLGARKFLAVYKDKQKRNSFLLICLGIIAAHAAAVGSGGNARFLMPAIPIMSLISGLGFSLQLESLKKKFWNRSNNKHNS
jgi:4-amino-4-deoxy-L-arabinose transferase-like glycosyltransferase